MRPAVAYVGVGANIEPRTNILRAVARMTRLTDVRRASTFYRTPALERPRDPDFINGVLEVHTLLDAAVFKATVLRCLEDRAGRQRSQDPYAPRPLDLDLLVHGPTVIDEPGLQLPDPDICTQRYVAQPLLELAPNLALPGREEALREIAEALPASPMAPMHAFTREIRAIARLVKPRNIPEPQSGGSPRTRQPTQHRRSSGRAL